MGKVDTSDMVMIINALQINPLDRLNLNYQFGTYNPTHCKENTEGNRENWLILVILSTEYNKHLRAPLEPSAECFHSKLGNLHDDDNERE